MSLLEEPFDGGVRRTVRGSLLAVWDLFAPIWEELTGQSHPAYVSLRRGEGVKVSEAALRSRLGPNQQDLIPHTESGWVLLEGANTMTETTAPSDQ